MNGLPGGFSGPLWRTLREHIAASAWWRPLAKVAAMLAALVVLAGIGRTMTATAAVGEQVSPPPSASASAVASGVGWGLSPLALDGGTAETPSLDAAVAPSSHSARATADDPVYLNEATAEDLRRLPGVGEKRATAILALRAKLGRFHQIEELMRVKGIGRATVKKWRGLAKIDRGDGGP